MPEPSSFSTAAVATAALPLPPHEQARADFYALLAALLLGPSPALLAALASAPPLPRPDETPLARAWQALLDAARRLGPQAVLDEHESLFHGVGAPAIDPYASRYLGVGLMDEPLARLRADLRTLGLARRAGAALTEDHLGALCETMRLLIVGAPGAPRRPLALQRRFFQRHLQPWAQAVPDDLRRVEAACAYAALADVAQAFFDAEAAAFDLDDDDLMEPPDEPCTARAAA